MASIYMVKQYRDFSMRQSPIRKSSFDNMLTFFENKKSLVIKRKAISMLEKELSLQILPDGGLMKEHVLIIL